ncbi:MAG: flagellar biosynthesis protein [Aquabacterium sp.]|nr:flagellar biosynthesis protein [Aquabacterium sp.]
MRDQAHGLRQLFAGREPRFVPLVHNPQVSGTGVVMERLCAAFADLGLRTLVVDAADSASPPHELASVDLAACIEPLSDQVSYLAARGLAMQYLDSRATLTGFLDALRTAAPVADVVLLHAGALDLRRMFAGRTPRPVLLAGSRADSLTHAYTSMKLLSQRLGALAYDLVVAGDVTERRAVRMGDRLAECADHFLGAALRQVAVVDPTAPAHSPLTADLSRLAADLVAALPGAAPANALAELPAYPAMQASQRRPASVGRMN